ncbi:NACHT and WD repeat domain-containing protein 2 [Echeneis naucrates]|uniref:NACHT and WD repeat domain-containing protein 2 n=1 Tax=Echeneis naucrates TaxID=173247 RepID=UPI0011146B87|nr:NACHT and WD repeat domain-containing protein 2-like [Echeneis naucrates]
MSPMGIRMDWAPADATCRSSCVKLYLCSNPDDSVEERRALRESVFPKLREQCRNTVGLDFTVIDPYESSDPSRWPDEHTRQQLIKECRESSAGPFLLALVGHQYGPASLPLQVEVATFQLLLQEGQQAGVSTQQLERLYQRDENSIPPSYRLRPPLAFACSAKKEDNEEDNSRIQAKEEELRKIIQTIVNLCVHNGQMSAERAQHYYRSALDTDLRFALDNRPDDDIIRRCLVYVHKVINAKGERERRQMSLQLQEAAISDLKTELTDAQLLSELCDDFLPSLITSRRLVVYTSTTECDHRHGYTTARRRSYAKSLCQQVYSDLVGLIDRFSMFDTREEFQTDQGELCDALSRLYVVIQPEEQEIRAYVRDRDKHCLLLVTGGPCTGKSVLLAHCARQIKLWLPESDPVVIPYFCKLQQGLSSKHLLSSLCNQIASRYQRDSPKQQPSFDLGQDQEDLCCTTNCRDNKRDSNIDLVTKQCPHPTGPQISLSELKEHFSSLLSLLPSPKQPLVLILDGFDHFKNDFIFPQIVESLPSPLPPSVKLILAVSSSQARVLQAIKLQYPKCSPPHCLSESDKEWGFILVQLGVANRKECVKMLASLLMSSGRTVTSGQQALVNQALASCCLTLYARLLHVHTSLWYSDSDVTESSLPSGVHASISALLDHLEQKHGSSIVARAVSFLSLSRTGLTEAELADLLSRNYKVLSEYVQQGDSPSSTLRVPQVEVERLLLDLRTFLIRGTFAGLRVLFWMSRHFKLVVAKRYLGTHEMRKEIHSEMADYFSGQGACGNTKPFLVNRKPGPNRDAGQTKICTDRQPSSKPFLFTSLFQDAGRLNLRNIVELPYHVQQSEKWEELECGLLMSFEFHQAMVQADLLGDLIAMLEVGQGSSKFTFLRERLLLASILKLSACLLQHTPLQLPIVMESGLILYLDVFPALKGYVREIRQRRRKRANGLGVLLCSSPSSVPPIHHLKCDSKSKHVSVAEASATDCGIVAEVMDDGSAWIWKSPGCGVAKVSGSCEQKELKFAGVKSSNHFLLLSTHCNKLLLWDVTGPEMFLELKDPFKTNQRAPNKIRGFVGCQKKLFMWLEGKSFVSLFTVSSEILMQFECQSSVTCVVCSSNGVYIYCGQDEGTVFIFDTDSRRLVGTCTNLKHSAVTSIILCEDKREMVCVDSSGNLTVWSIATKTQPRLVKERLTVVESKNILNTDYSKEIQLLLVCQSNQVILWDTSEWELSDHFLAPRGRTFIQAVLSQDGHHFLALLDACAFILVWRVDTGECVLYLEANTQPHALLKMASDVVCVTRDGCLTVWDCGMIDSAGSAPKTGCAVKEVVFERTGEWFYTSDGSETVWRWSLETGFPCAAFLHHGPVQKLCLSPNDIHLLTLSAGDVYVWLTETCQNILRIKGTRAIDILITPNGNFGVSISRAGLSRVWKLANGSVICSIHLYLSNAVVSPESTFLIGCRHGDLIAASLWSGSISKRFSCVEASEQVVAFHALSEHPDFVMVMTSSGAMYTWKVTEETVCRHFQLPQSFQCQLQVFQMSSNGNYALLSTDNDTINLLDLSQIRLFSFKAEGPVIKACLDKTGHFAAYLSLEKLCACDLLVTHVLTVVRLSDGEKLGSVCLSKNPLTLAVCKQQCVFVGFEDGSVGVYSVSEIMLNREDVARCREKQCPFERAPSRWLALPTPNITWS